MLIVELEEIIVVVLVDGVFVYIGVRSLWAVFVFVRSLLFLEFCCLVWGIIFFLFYLIVGVDFDF